MITQRKNWKNLKLGNKGPDRKWVYQTVLSGENDFGGVSLVFLFQCCCKYLNLKRNIESYMQQQKICLGRDVNFYKKTFWQNFKSSFCSIAKGESPFSQLSFFLSSHRSLSLKCKIQVFELMYLQSHFTLRSAHLYCETFYMYNLLFTEWLFLSEPEAMSISQC